MAQVIQAGPSGIGGGRGANLDQEVQGYLEQLNGLFAEDPSMKHRFPIESLEGLLDAMVDGVILAKIVNQTKPGTINEAQLKLDLGKPNAADPNSKTLFALSNNLDLVLQGARTLGCKIQGIAPADIIEKKEELVLSLLWQVLRVHLMKSVNMFSHPELIRLLKKGESLATLMEMSADEILQRWFNYHLRQAGHDQTIANFGTDLKDGVNFIVLMRQIAPKLVDHSLIDAALASDKIEDRARAVVRLAENLNCRQFISIRSITSGHARLNLAFTAVLFNSHIGIVLPSEEEVAKLTGRIDTLEQRVAELEAQLAESMSAQESLEEARHNAVERLASQMDTQRREYAAQIDALQQQHSAETAEQQQALEQLRYEKELAEAAAAQKQQQLEASEAAMSEYTRAIQDTQAEGEEYKTRALEAAHENIVRLAAKDETIATQQLQIVNLEHDVNVLRQANEQLSQQLAETIDSKDQQIAKLSADYEQLAQEHAAQGASLKAALQDAEEWSTKSTKLTRANKHIEERVDAVATTVKSSLGNIGDEEAALEELQRTDKLKKLTDLLIKRNREQAFKIDTLLDKVSLISQELNKNARARACPKCGYTFEINVFGGPGSAAAAFSASQKSTGGKGIMERFSRAISGKDAEPAEHVISEPIRK